MSNYQLKERTGLKEDKAELPFGVYFVRERNRSLSRSMEAARPRIEELQKLFKKAEKDESVELPDLDDIVQTYVELLELGLAPDPAVEDPTPIVDGINDLWVRDKITFEDILDLFMWVIDTVQDEKKSAPKPRKKKSSG